MTGILYYIHDPMCSWCWGYRPVWCAFQQALPESVTVQYVAGGLASDTDRPMPIEQQQAIQRHWRNIQQKLGTEFNFDFWKNNTPHRSTYIACRASIAAHQQGFEKQLIDAIQQAYYLRAMNPSNSSVLIQLVEKFNQQNNTHENEIDIAQFKTDFISIDTQNELNRQMLLARELTHQGFPSLVFEHKGQRSSITLNYQDYKVSLDEIQRIMAGDK